MTTLYLHNRLAGQLLACLIFALLSTTTAFAQQPLTPAQAAFLKAETSKADSRFVLRVAEIVGVKESLVQKSLPEQGRITDPVARLIASLERSTGKQLTEEDKAKIRAADEDRHRTVAAAALVAQKK